MINPEKSLRYISTRNSRTRDTDTTVIDLQHFSRNISQKMLLPYVIPYLENNSFRDRLLGGVAEKTKRGYLTVS